MSETLDPVSINIFMFFPFSWPRKLKSVSIGTIISGSGSVSTLTVGGGLALFDWKFC